MKFRTLVLMAALGGAGGAHAQAPAGGASPDMQAARAAIQKACAADAASLCSGLTGREMNQCLRQNVDKVSPGCKDAMSKMPARPAAPPQG
ncbi:MAG TPA: hypothetical protein VMU59_02320 [Caulobacteraceae bacterium]|nr:hypothetical protein [Caulobacteraceae bacterium]